MAKGKGAKKPAKKPAFAKKPAPKGPSNPKAKRWDDFKAEKAAGRVPPRES